MSYQHPRISVEQACQAYSLSFSDLNYDNGLLSGWVSREDLTYPLVHFINPATKTKVGAVDRWTFRLLIVEQILEINQSQGVINSIHDTMDFVSDAIQQELNRNEMAEVTNWVAREVQQFGDANVTGWLVDVTFEGAGQCVGSSASQVATPRFVPATGEFGGFAEFELECDTPEALVYYTLDGTTPTPQTGILYEGGVVQTSSQLPKAKAFKSGMVDSNVSTANYTIVPISLAFNVAGGIFPIDSPPTIVPITNNIAAVVHRTTDGSVPDETAPLFNTPFTPTQNVTLSGRAFLNPAAPSNVVAQTYQLKLNAPTVNAGGTFISERLVQAAPAAVGVNQYRINSGSWVTGNSVLLATSANVTFRAVSPNHVTSDEVTRAITIQVADVTASLAGGTYEGAINVTLPTTTPGAEIRFTLDGSTPTPSSTLAIGAIPIGNSSTLRYRAFKAGCTPSNIGQQVYVINVRLYIAVSETTNPALSRDLGATWQEITSPFGLNQGFSRSFGSIINQGGGVWLGLNNSFTPRRSVNLGASWSQIAAWLTDASWAWSNGQDVLVLRQGAPAGTSNLFMSSDGGVTLTELRVNGFAGQRAWRGFVKRGNNIMATAVVSGVVVVFSSTDNGASWSQFSSVRTNIGAGIGWASPDFQQRYVLVGGGYIFTINGGASWTDTTLSGGSALAWLAFCEDSPLTVFGIHISGGATIIRRSVNGSLPSTNILTIPSFVAAYIEANQDGSRLLVSGQGRTFLVTLSPTPVATEITANLPAILSSNAYNFQMV